MDRKYLWPLPFLLPILLSACAPGPKLPIPKMHGPAHYLADHEAWAGSSQKLRLQDSAPLEDWWRLFGSHALNQDVHTALRANPDIHQAQLALLRAHQIEKVAAAGLAPQIIGNGQLARSRALRTGANGGTSYRIPGNLYSLLLGSVEVSYSPDLFGKATDRLQDAQAQRKISQAQLSATQQVVAAAVAKALISAAAAQDQWRSARQIAAADARLLHLIQQEYQLGASNLQVLRQQEALTASAKAAVIPLRVEMSRQQHALATLLGRYPAQGAPFPSLHEFHLPKNIPAVVPSRLLMQRPDIVAARAAVEAAAAEAHLAAADRYPQIDISADLGKAAQSGTLFFSPVSTLWGLAGSIVAPIYEGGALRAQEKAAVDSYRIAVSHYHQVVLRAFRQVADALRALQGADQSYTQRRLAAQAAEQALHLAQTRYRDGVSNYATVLDAEIANEKDQQANLQAESERYLDTVALFLAMGEGPSTSSKDHSQESHP
ncbi:efflux transporter outer membrane subunit [Acidithiobacillus sp. AMEEHan]|uniref:efflux transporter outer membrane subunit n=1 Tax=Acidithiobacillus sp. AMEEHan TaxID=2994951 RepID=UPI0027E403E6|nr:efflux transporter outer membrane subunit [Acidithiobacillus sp. AMEEHan]